MTARQTMQAIRVHQYGGPEQLKLEQFPRPEPQAGEVLIRVHFIIDDLESVQPWKPRQIKVHGLAEIVERDGQFGEKEYLAITPTVSWSLGIEAGVNYQAGKFAPKKIVWTKE